MYCEKHIGTKTYLGNTIAAACKHLTPWKYHLHCEACSNKRKICQECGEPVLKGTLLLETEKRK